MKYKSHILKRQSIPYIMNINNRTRKTPLMNVTVLPQVKESMIFIFLDNL